MIPLLDSVNIKSNKRGRPRKPLKVLAAEKAYDSKDKRAALRRGGIRPQWPKRVWKRKKNKGRPIKISVPRFQQERCFPWLKKKYRRLVVRCERISACFDAFLSLARIHIWIKKTILVGEYLGQILELVKANTFYWLLEWLGSLGWVVRESLTWLVPVSASMAIFMVLMSPLSGMGVFFLMLMIVAPTLAVFVHLWFIGFGFFKSVKDSLWVGGLIISFVLFYIFLLFGSSVSLGFSLILGIIATGLGSIAWIQMESQGFSKNQTLTIFGGVTALGLVSGWCFGRF
ncbi:MAG: hypothetical protein HRU34_24635 [Richelia sp.]|nr:hypothetical protein [Richelia sp.]